VFSDHPPDRSKGGWKDWAFVYKSEAMDVVYLQGAALSRSFNFAILEDSRSGDMSLGRAWRYVTFLCTHFRAARMFA